MKTNKKLNLLKIFVSIAIFGLSLSFMNSCDKPEPEGEKIELVFSNLSVDNDSIYVGETVTFTATATGKDINYLWTASAGSLLGGGNQVTLTPTPCLSGDITVTCDVTDAYNETKTKTATITILER